MKTAILFYLNKTKEAEQSLQKTEQILDQLPYLRETSGLKVLQGVFLIKNGKESAGRNSIDEGRDMIRQSGHTYYFLFIYQLLSLLLPKSGASSDAVDYYHKEAARYFKYCESDQLKPDIEKQIFSII